MALLDRLPLALPPGALPEQATQQVVTLAPPGVNTDGIFKVPGFECWIVLSIRAVITPGDATAVAPTALLLDADGVTIIGSASSNTFASPAIVNLLWSVDVGTSYNSTSGGQVTALPLLSAFPGYSWHISWLPAAHGGSLSNLAAIVIKVPVSSAGLGRIEDFLGADQVPGLGSGDDGEGGGEAPPEQPPEPPPAPPPPPEPGGGPKPIGPPIKPPPGPGSTRLPSG